MLLVAWDALIAVVAGSEFYLHRFPVDVEDNLFAWKQVTQVIMLRRTVKTLIIIITVTAVLMTFPEMRRYGIDFLVSAGAAGLILGLAARPLFSNLIAGVQIAITQPFRIDDEVVVQGETGRIERIAGTYVVVRIWDPTLTVPGCMDGNSRGKTRTSGGGARRGNARDSSRSWQSHGYRLVAANPHELPHRQR
jgi:small-conductance mechanosensitive channel